MGPVHRMINLYYHFEEWPIEFEKACNDIAEIKGSYHCPKTDYGFEPIDCDNECCKENTKCWMMYYICNATVPKV